MWLFHASLLIKNVSEVEISLERAIEVSMSGLWVDEYVTRCIQFFQMWDGMLNKIPIFFIETSQIHLTSPACGIMASTQGFFPI